MTINSTVNKLTVIVTNLLGMRHLPSLDEGCWDIDAGAQFLKCLRPNWSPGQYSHLHLHASPDNGNKQNICVMFQHVVVMDNLNVQRENKRSHLNFIVGLNEHLKAHLLFQVKAKLFQTTEDAVMRLSLSLLVLPAAIYNET